MTELDARGLLCPLPVLRLRKFLSNAAPGTRVALIATACGVLAAIAPARRAAKLDPAQAIRI